MRDLELLILYREKGDLTAYKVLYERYLKYSHILASEIVESFRMEFRIDFTELKLIGLYSFDAAVRKFSFENTSLKAFWKKIAKNAMMNEAYEEIARSKFLTRSQTLEERTNDTSKSIYGHSFSSGIDGAEDMLMNDIKEYLFNPRNRIDAEDAYMFLEYLETPSFTYIAKKLNLSNKTVRRKINDLRERIIIDVLGEDI